MEAYGGKYIHRAEGGAFPVVIFPDELGII
jgi:hypothetical protein